MDFRQKMLSQMTEFCKEKKISFENAEEVLKYFDERSKIESEFNFTLKTVKKVLLMKKIDQHTSSERFINKKIDDINLVVKEIVNTAPKGQLSAEKVKLGLISRVKFCHLYKLKKLMSYKNVVKEEKLSYLNKIRLKNANSKMMFRKTKKFTETHQSMRNKAYPYKWEGYSTPIYEGRIDNLFVGYIMMNGNYIFDITVLPEYYHQGIGARLLKFALKKLLVSKRTKVHLDVRETNVNATKLYQRLGFEVVKRVFPDYYDYHGGFKMVGDIKTIIDKMERK